MKHTYAFHNATAGPPITQPPPPGAPSIRDSFPHFFETSTPRKSPNSCLNHPQNPRTRFPKRVPKIPSLPLTLTLKSHPPLTLTIPHHPLTLSLSKGRAASTNPHLSHSRNPLRQSRLPIRHSREGGNPSSLSTHLPTLPSRRREMAVTNPP